ncbi:MAG: transglutaminase-like cysteine peptidase [Stellaceae bacterium]
MRLWRSLPLLLVLASPGAGLAASQEALSPPALFGTREVFSADSSAFFKWHGMLERFAAERRQGAAACAPAAVERCAPAEWVALVAELKRLDLRGKLDRVNAAINRHPYVPSFVNWHESNHWETPFEFLRKGGQCQDYAIAKYLLLRAAGVPASNLRLVVLRDTHLALDHAVTIAYVGGEALVLDNQQRAVVPASTLDHYRPYYSINEQGWWLHRAAGARYAAIH